MKTLLAKHQLAGLLLSLWLIYLPVPAALVQESESIQVPILEPGGVDPAAEPAEANQNLPQSQAPTALQPDLEAEQEPAEAEAEVIPSPSPVSDQAAVATAAAEALEKGEFAEEWETKIQKKVQTSFDKDDKVSYGEPVTIGANEVIEGDVVSFGGPVSILGTVKGSVVSIGGPITISGAVYSDVVSTGGPVSLASSAEVKGDVVTMGGKLIKADGAVVQGEVIELSNQIVDRVVKFVHPKLNKRIQLDLDPAEGLSSPRFSIVSFVAKLLGLIGAIGFGVLVLLLFPRNVTEVANRLRMEPLRSFAYGLLSYVLVILVSFVLIFTCLGIPISLVLLVFFCVTIAFGLISGSYMVGESLIHLFKTGAINPLIAVVSGMALLGIILLIPFFVGVSLWFLFSIFAVGATIMTRYGTNRPWFGGNNHRTMRELELPPLEEPPVTQQ